MALFRHTFSPPLPQPLFSFSFLIMRGRLVTGLLPLKPVLNLAWSMISCACISLFFLSSAIFFSKLTYSCSLISNFYRGCIAFRCIFLSSLINLNSLRTRYFKLLVSRDCDMNCNLFFDMILIWCFICHTNMYQVHFRIKSINLNQVNYGL